MMTIVIILIVLKKTFIMKTDQNHEAVLKKVSTIFVLIKSKTNIKIHHEHSCRIGYFNQGRGFGEPLVEIPTPRVLFHYPSLTYSCWIFSGYFHKIYKTRNN